MQAADRTNFVMLADGSLMQCQSDGSYRRVPSLTDHARVARLTDEEIEAMPPDPDHPFLDDHFWSDADALGNEGVGLDADVLAFFRRKSSDYRSLINSVLRSYMASSADK